MRGILAPVSARLSDSPWSVEEDTATGVLTIYLSGHLYTETVVEAVGVLVERLRQRNLPTRVVADLFDVTSFDVHAPLAAVRIAAPMKASITEIEIIAHRPLVLVAAISAANLLDLRCTVRRVR